MEAEYETAGAVSGETAMTAGSVPIEAWIEEIIKRTVAEHVSTCPVAERVVKLEIRLSSLVAFMAGSGLLGGGAGAVVSHFLRA